MASATIYPTDPTALRSEATLMNKLALLAVILALAACGTGGRAARYPQKSPTNPAPRPTNELNQDPGSSPADARGSDAATTFPTAPAPTPSGRFARVLGIVDCPGGCPSFSVSEALAQPGADVDPVLVDGFLFVDGDGSILLCESLGDDATATCSGTRLLFEGQGALELLEGASWSDELQLLGTVHPAP
jgi:hypothetical protein